MSTSVSVVVLVLNEEAAIDRLLERLGRCSNTEVVVADGGSRDRTVERAERHRGVRVIRAERGRARQMNADARVAKGDVLVFLHADTTLPDHSLDLMRRAVEDGGDFGCCTIRIESDDPRLWLASRMISLRSQLIASCTGDQAQFFRRTFFEDLGGFPDLPLFEDMDIVRIAKRRGKFVCIDAPVSTSARRWHTHGVSRTMVAMLALRGLYHLGVDPRRLAKFYASNPRKG